MSKIAVGIGEDFPADDNAAESGPDAGRCTREDVERVRREAYCKWRERRRQRHQQWREEWRARRRAFREHMHQIRREIRDDDRGRDFHWTRGVVWVALILFATMVLFGVVSFIISHMFVLAGAIALLFLVFAYHRGFHPFDLPQIEYLPNRPAQAAH